MNGSKASMTPRGGLPIVVGHLAGTLQWQRQDMGTCGLPNALHLALHQNCTLWHANKGHLNHPRPSAADQARDVSSFSESYYLAARFCLSF